MINNVFIFFGCLLDIIVVLEREFVLVLKENGKVFVGGNGVLRCIFFG